MAPGFEVVQRVENKIETTEPFNIELRIFDVRMVCDDRDIGIELLRGLFSDLLE